MENIDLSKIDFTKIDPKKVSLGTDMQDCALIAKTFERGAHSTHTEAAVFATLNRSVENMKSFATAASDTVNSYLMNPEDIAKNATKQASDLVSSANVSTGGGGSSGSSAATDGILQGLNMGKEEDKTSTLTDSFGETLLDFAKDCIPCGDRLMAFLELHPHVDLLGALEDNLTASLQLLSDIGGLLNNFDIYADFCALLDALKFMCIPDLQRIIALFTAMLILDIPKLDGLIGMIQVLIQPIFMPIFQAITSLLDQFSSLVVSPIDCIIDALIQQMNKINISVPKTKFTPSFKVTSQEGQDKLKEIQGEINSGLKELTLAIQEGKETIQAELDFYIEEIKALLGETTGSGGIHLRLSLRKLKLIRMVSFIIAIITAISKGHASCSNTGKTPQASEIDGFFKDFLSPNSPFDMYVDEEGQIVIEEQGDPLLAKGENVFQFKGEDFISPEVAEVTKTLSDPIRAVIPCRFETTSEDVTKVNRWIEELSKE
jgi:hypothetical protein